LYFAVTRVTVAVGVTREEVCKCTWIHLVSIAHANMNSKDKRKIDKFILKSKIKKGRGRKKGSREVE
jgi:hypothetical protein